MNGKQDEAMPTEAELAVRDAEAEYEMAMRQREMDEARMLDYGNLQTLMVQLKQLKSELSEVPRASEMPWASDRGREMIMLQLSVLASAIEAPLIRLIILNRVSVKGDPTGVWNHYLAKPMEF